MVEQHYGRGSVYVTGQGALLKVLLADGDYVFMYGCDRFNEDGGTCKTGYQFIYLLTHTQVSSLICKIWTPFCNFITCYQINKANKCVILCSSTMLWSLHILILHGYLQLIFIYYLCFQREVIPKIVIGKFYEAAKEVCLERGELTEITPKGNLPCRRSSFLHSYSTYFWPF